MDILPLILIWVILGIVVLGYVTYRLVTDRRSPGKRHVLYPTISNPGDGMFPDKGDYLTWSGYGFVLLGLLGFVVGLYLEATGEGLPSYLVHIVGLSLVAGVAFLVLARWKRSRKR